MGKSREVEVTLDDDGGGQTEELPASIGLGSAIALIVGSIIGSGIFVSAKGITREVGSVAASLGVWMAGGLFSLVGALCYAELGCLIPGSGGDYEYCRLAYGDFVAFVRLWTDCFFLRPCTLAVLAHTFAGYILDVTDPCDPALIPATRNTAATLLAFSCLGILMYVNCCSTNVATKIQIFFTLGKCLALVVIIISGCVVYGLRGAVNLRRPFEETAFDPGRYAIALYTSLFAYQGWNQLNVVSGEMVNPTRDLPRAIVISCLLVTFVYTATVCAYLSVTSIVEMATSQSIGVLFAGRLYGKAAVFLPLCVVLSTFGSINGALFSSARLCFVAARRGHLPTVFNTIHLSHVTPMASTLFTSVLAGIYSLQSDVYTMIEFLGFATILLLGVTVTSLFVFRRTMPTAKRPVKVYIGFPIFYIAISALLLFFATKRSPRSTIMSMSIMATSIPAYILLVKFNPPKNLQKNAAFLSRTLQKLINIIPETTNR